MTISGLLLNFLEVKYLQNFKKKHRDIVGMACRMVLTYDEFIDILDTKHFAESSTGYNLPPRS